VEASEKSEENLKKALELRNKMIMIFAHDVRCPLRFLADIAFNLKQKPRSTFIECYQNELDVLFLGARGAYAIANDALDWIKSTAASEPFMIHGVPNAIKRVIANHNGQLKEYQIAIHLHLAYPAAVWARAKTLEIVLENLLQNAIKYCEKTIVISLMDLSETHFCLQIYNDGPGLANEEKLKALNEGKAIRQSTGFRSAAGAGIGLLVVREILIDMDGDISFSNDVAGFEVKIKFRKSEVNGI
jgi:signal transduction histidine kinase